MELQTDRISALDGPEAKRGKKIAIMASGRGSDFQAIIDSNERGDVNLDIAILVCNNKDAFVIERAKKHSIPYVIMDHRGRARDDYDREIDEILTRSGIELIVLAGFMRILSPWFVLKWKDRIINIHPALLPSFPGAHAHRDALEYGVKFTGLTIHFVDEDVDHGPIIFQYPVKILDNDDEGSLSKRVLCKEHEWYPKVIQWIVDGRVRREGRKVRIDI
ncbi:MAG: phosphoribosylglycinamide formyltransferase [Candidatus Thermoplasmatota archaeon]|nr:phosphoribosylglycinamide formyltransferase [Candidatus Thermoplasmatota archaeon]